MPRSHINTNNLESFKAPAHSGAQWVARLYNWGRLVQTLRPPGRVKDMPHLLSPSSSAQKRSKSLRGLDATLNSKLGLEHFGLVDQA